MAVINGALIQHYYRLPIVVWNGAQRLVACGARLCASPPANTDYRDRRGSCNDHLPGIVCAVINISIARRIAQGVELPAVTEPSVTPGGGVSGIVEGRRLAIGTARYVRKELDLDHAVVEPQAQSGGVVLASESGVIGRFDFDGEISVDTLDTVTKLRHSDVTLHLLTGDTDAEARRVAQHLGIEHVRARCTPREKVHYIRTLQAAGGVVVMVGDGINDAPALAGADVSIAVADAVTLATSNADIVITNHNLSSVVMAITVARRALNVVRQNIAWAIGYNTVALVAAAAGFVAPWLAAVGMATSSALVTANAWRAGGGAMGQAANPVARSNSRRHEY